MSQAPSCRRLHVPHPRTCWTGRHRHCEAGPDRLGAPRASTEMGRVVGRVAGLFTCVIKCPSVLEVSATLSPGHIVPGPGRPPGQVPLAGPAPTEGWGQGQGAEGAARETRAGPASHGSSRCPSLEAKHALWSEEDTGLWPRVGPRGAQGLGNRGARPSSRATLSVPATTTPPTAFCIVLYAHRVGDRPEVRRSQARLLGQERGSNIRPAQVPAVVQEDTAWRRPGSPQPPRTGTGQAVGLLGCRGWGKEDPERAGQAHSPSLFLVPDLPTTTALSQPPHGLCRGPLLK